MRVRLQLGLICLFAGASSISVASIALPIAQNADLVGTWKEEFPAFPDSRVPIDTIMKSMLILRADGNFELHFQNNFMYERRLDAAGTYLRKGSVVTFTGKGVTFLADGTSSQHHDAVVEFKLTLEDGKLATSGEDSVGQKPYKLQSHNVPPLRPPLSGPALSVKALSVIRAVKHAYASFKTFEGSGTITGPGHRGKGMRLVFSLIFARPNKISLSVDDESNDSKPPITSTAGMDGHHAWALKGTATGNSKVQRPVLPKALSIADPSGLAARCLPPLLMPKLLGQSAFFDDVCEASVDLDEKVHGHPCYGLRLVRKNGSLYRLWVDKTTFIVRESDDETADISTTYEGTANPKLNPRFDNFSRPRTH